MRRALLGTAIVCSLAVPSLAAAQNAQVQGFGGMTFGDVTNSSTFGGGIALPFGDNMQIIAEGGRMTDVMPSLIGTIVDFTPIDFGVSAWYGEAGVRFIGSSHRAVRPYAEATAGFARLRTGLHGTGADGIVNTRARLLRPHRSAPRCGRRRDRARWSGVHRSRLPVQEDPGVRFAAVDPDGRRLQREPGPCRRRS
jgi:hypothetical protein